jgi:hypothetical protein
LRKRRWPDDDVMQYYKYSQLSLTASTEEERGGGRGIIQ